MYMLTHVHRVTLGTQSGGDTTLLPAGASLRPARPPLGRVAGRLPTCELWS